MDRVAQQLVSYATDLCYRRLPTQTVHEAKRRVIDSLGAAIGGLNEAPSRIASAVAQRTSAYPGATIVGTTHSAAPDSAAFANGTMVHSQDYMDTYLSTEACHPADNISTILALAEHTRADGKAVIVATVLAYEVMCRLADVVPLRQGGWDHAVLGSISSAVAAGKLLRLSPDELHDAIAVAAVSNIALRQTRTGEISMWKACAGPHASRSALFTTMLVAQGLRGPALPFEGANGFQQQISGPFALAPLGGRRRPFMIHATSLKFWPVQYHTQTGLEAALALRSHLSSLEDIDTVAVSTSDVTAALSADTPNKWRPKTSETADHSLPYIIAVALRDGSVTRSSFDAPNLNDTKLLGMLTRLQILTDSEFSSRYPRALSSRIDITTKTGHRLSRQVDYPKGHPRNPMTDAEVGEKFGRLASAVLSQRQVDRALDQLWNLERVADLKTLLRLFAVA